MPMVATTEPQSPATRYPTKVAVMTTGPGLIMPIATAIRNWRSSSHPVCQSVLKERNDDEAAAEGERPCLQEEEEEPGQDRPRRRPGGGDGRWAQWCRRHQAYAESVTQLLSAERAIDNGSHDSGGKEEQRNLGPDGHGHDEACSRNPPLQLVFHPELRQPITGVEDQRDDGGAHTLEDRGRGGQPPPTPLQR